MKQSPRALIAQLRHQPIALLIVGLLFAGIGQGLWAILGLAWAHWLQPNLYGDSFAFVARGSATNLLSWLTAQHNEHRIVWAKAASLVETELLQVPPGQSALFQNLALILGCAGLWSWLCRRMLQRTDLCLVTALAGWLLLLNPWQYENLGWEFQTPWFLINALVLVGALLLSVPTAGRWPKSLAAAVLPWFALTSTGQGLALAVAFTACAWLHSRRLGALVTASTALGGLTFFGLLPYSKPAGHPELGFQLDYFLRAWLGGPWQGLTVLAVVIAAVLMGRRQPIAKAQWPALLMPGLFSVLFAGMITLSRAGFGVEQANSSRYISHSLMLGLTALLALALTDDHSNRRTTPLLGGFLVLLTTISSFPQSLQAGGLSYVEAWAQGRHRSDEYRQRFVCQAQQAALAARQIRLLQPCKAIYPDQTLVNEYFQGNLEVQPLGWHQHLIQNAIGTTGGAIRHHVDQQKLTTATLQLQGWAFLANDPNQPLYLLADYGTQEKLGWPVDRPRRDVKRTHHIKNRNVGFDAALPRTLEGQPLRSVLLAGPKQSVQIWEDPNADG